jgi:hypothetical protein
LAISDESDDETMPTAVQPTAEEPEDEEEEPVDGARSCQFSAMCNRFKNSAKVGFHFNEIEPYLHSPA